MLAVFQQIADGTLQEDAQIDDLLTRMITVSDNEATNTLVDRLGNGDTQAGYAVVNGTAQRYGFTQSHLDQRMGNLTGDTGKQTSVGDQGRFLAAACRGQLVSAEYSQRMIGLMLQQTRRSKIPAGLPSQVSVANKTGESPGVENDSAMVFAAGDGERIAGATPGTGDYVIAVMSENVPMPSEAQNDIRTMSSTVWSALQ
nr:serine hydrolase [Bifidobacterium pongonis]